MSTFPQVRPGVPGASLHPAPNLQRRGSTNRAAHVDKGSSLVPPVVLYGQARLEDGCSVGKYTYFGNGCVASNADIGNYCAIGRYVEIGSKPHPLDMMSVHPFQYEATHFVEQPGYQTDRVEWRTVDSDARVTIGHDVWIGHKACIRPGVTIGTGAVIGSGAIVTRDVAPYAVVAGSPARLLRHRFEDDVRSALLASQWWHLDPADLSGVDYADVPSAIAEVGRRRARLQTLVEAALREWSWCLEDETRHGVLWFDVEKSYACPDAVAGCSTVVLDSPWSDGLERRPIIDAWFDPVTNAFGVWSGALPGPVTAGSLRLRLE
ncbi:CatB-related O-acetyltransferase [Quadrisphaera sp. KR29]|uniref:CatB-related O-acetyltransferase n=1 Tax=Quadrisphaera sp. KR29 TaxID=3461391 RepID=UPI0040442DAC